MDAEALFSQLEFNTGEFPEDILTEAIDQHGSIIPLLLEELRELLKPSIQDEQLLD